MIKFKSKTDSQTLKIFWKELIKDKKYFYLSLLFPVSVLLLNTLVPLFIGRILANVIQTNSVSTSFIMLLIVTAIFGIITNRFGFRSFLVNIANTMQKLQDLSFKKLINKNVSFYNNHFSGQIISDAIGYDRAFQ